MQQQSLFIEDNQHQLHVRHITTGSGSPVLMLHGTIENGRIFYTHKGKGLGCYLAKQGFDVYVADFRGKGLSRPTLHEDSAHGQHEMIIHDIPAFINFVYQQTNQPIHIICHSWGGVLLHSCLARFPELLNKVNKIICFGTKRSVYQKSFHKFWKVDLLWNRIAPLLAKRKGYVNAVKLKMGADNESYQFLQQCVDWVKVNPWVDPEDNFDYAQAASTAQWPDIWHITGVNDDLLGHIDDVKAFIKESSPQAKISLLSKANGYKCDYDHINILTASEAVEDHFIEVAHWLSEP